MRRRGSEPGVKARADTIEAAAGGTGGSYEGVARDASTLREVLQAFEAAGFTSGFRSLEPGRLRCLRCRAESPASHLRPSALRRLEGASDPADMLAVVALTCAHCGARGALVANYGPEATAADSAVLRDLPSSPAPRPEAPVG